MADDLEKRISAMERVQDKLLTTLDQINATLLKFERHIDELFELKTKIDSIDVIWRRIDDLQTNYNKLDKDLHVLKSEHATCTPIVGTVASCKIEFENRMKTIEEKVSSSTGFATRLWGSILEKVIWAIIVGGAMSAVYLAGKGAFKP